MINKQQVMKKYLIFMTILGVLLLCGYIYYVKNQQETISLADSQNKEEKSKSSKSIDSKEASDVKPFLTDVLSKYIQYNQKEPSANIEAIKPYVSSEIYDREKAIYEKPLEIKSRKLQEIVHFKAESSTKYTILAKVESELESKVTEEVLYTFLIEPKENKWQIRGLEYVSFEDY